MNIIMTPMGSTGDVHPFVGLGIELRSRGHRVTIIANALFQSLIERAGLDFLELGTCDEFDEITVNPDIWHWRKGPRLIVGESARVTRQQYELVASKYVPDDTVLIHHLMSFGSRTFEDKHEVPAATIHLAPMSIRTVHDMPALAPGRDLSRTPRWMKRLVWWIGDRFFVDSTLEPPINEFRQSLGLLPVRRPLNEWHNSPRCVIGMFPEWYGRPQPDWPDCFVQTDFPLWDDQDAPGIDPALTSFLGESTSRETDGPIAFTFGTPNRHAASQYEHAAKIATHLDRRAILLTSHREQVPVSLPANVLHVPYAPFSKVFPRCSLVVHHGGIGTTAQALAAGVPQLVVPMAFDQPDQAERLRRLGVGDWIAPRRFGSVHALRIVEHLLESAPLRDRARVIASRIDRPSGIRQTSQVIEQLAE